MSEQKGTRTSPRSPDYLQNAARHGRVLKRLVPKVGLKRLVLKAGLKRLVLGMKVFGLETVPLFVPLKLVSAVPPCAAEGTGVTVPSALTMNPLVGGGMMAVPTAC